MLVKPIPMLTVVLAVALTGLLAAPQAWAQGEQALELLRPEETLALRRLLAAPVPEGLSADRLRQHFTEKELAARRLADVAARKAVIADAMERMPRDARWPNQMGTILSTEGRWDESRRLYELAVERAGTPVDRRFFESNLLQVLAQAAHPETEERLLRARQASLAALEDPGVASADRVQVLRTLANVAAAEHLLLSRRSRLVESLAAAAESAQRNRSALDAVLAMPAAARGQLRFVPTELAAAQKRHAYALRQLERDAEAEAVLQEHIRTITQYPVAADFAAGAHHALALLRMDQRAFGEAEAQLRLALQVFDRLSVAREATNRINVMAELVFSLWAQGRVADARAVLTGLDHDLAGDAQSKAKAANVALARGLVYLSSGLPERAVTPLASLAGQRLRQYGAGHYLAAASQGLHGVALWRSADPVRREEGAELLRRAVPDMLSPRNADQATDRGLRKPIRDLILAAYVDAMTQRGGLGALWALGVADHLRGGITAQALADAAVRAAANDPALAGLVRQEQDARRELLAAEQMLLADGGGETLTAAAAAQLRTRMSELEALRQQVQQRLRERFPGYDQIVRPALPDPAAVSQRLARGEAMVVLMPTERALLAWVITADELPQFVRVDVSAARLQALVQRVLKGVEFGAPGQRQPVFDPAAAHELYLHTLAALEPRLRLVQHLVLAISGPLAAAPMAALMTEAPGQGPPAWLVRRWSLTQVPSVSAWLSLRQLPRARPAPEALLAWGDPSFAAQAATKVAQSQRNLTLSRNAASPVRYSDLPPLPETRDEILAIAGSVKADLQRDLRLGAQATRESVLEASRSGELARKRIVIFATHGLVAGDFPGLKEPALALAAPPPGSAITAGLLTMEDVLGLKLNADWVVLSACNTAAADGRGEEVLSGLARGFFYAGSRSVLVTQWAVETESAKLLTTGTFEHHARAPQSSKAESLRQAMLQVMAKPAYAHPAFWAPYVLVGDGAR